MKVLVTGATGAFGPAVVEALVQSGYEIRVFSRNPPEEGLFPPEVDVLRGDVTDKAAVRSAVQDREVVLHLAGLLHIANPPPEMREKYERVNVGGTATVMEAALKADVKRVVFFSTIAVYGPGNGRIFDEESSAQPDTYYGQTKLVAEGIVLNARLADGRPLGSVLRLAALYGARIKGNYERLTRALARNRFIPLGDGRNRRTLVHDRDAARAAIRVLEHPEAAGRVYNVSDGKFHTLNEIIGAICAGLGKNPPRFSLPVAPIRFAAGLLEDGARLLGRRSPIVRSTIDKYTEDIAVSSERLQKELGFSPQYDLMTGWRESIREMREAGLI